MLFLWSGLSWREGERDCKHNLKGPSIKEFQRYLIVNRAFAVSIFEKFSLQSQFNSKDDNLTLSISNCRDIKHKYKSQVARTVHPSYNLLDAHLPEMGWAR